jgi:hypothetical protein
VEFRVEQVAVVSFRHLTEQTWEAGCGNFDLGASTFGNEHGFFCRVQPPAEVPLAPEDLQGVLAFLSDHPLEWVRFDETGPILPGLELRA